jgi:hypothetical protein
MIHNEQQLYFFDSAWYKRLENASPFLTIAMANILSIKGELSDRTKCDLRDIWPEFKELPIPVAARRIGLPLKILRKIPQVYIEGPSLIDELTMLRMVLALKPKPARWLRHSRTVKLDVVRVMSVVDSDDAKLWAWLTTLSFSSLGWITDHLVTINHLLKHRGRTWQHGMIICDVSLCRTYERLLIQSPFPAPPFKDDPDVIEMIRSGSELASWAREQRNCALTYTSRCLTGDNAIYRMMAPAPATILIATAVTDMPWLVEAKSAQNGELNQQQQEVLISWCTRNGISTNWWLTEGER